MWWITTLPKPRLRNKQQGPGGNPPGPCISSLPLEAAAPPTPSPFPAAVSSRPSDLPSGGPGLPESAAPQPVPLVLRCESDPGRPDPQRDCQTGHPRTAGHPDLQSLRRQDLCFPQLPAKLFQGLAQRLRLPLGVLHLIILGNIAEPTAAPYVPVAQRFRVVQAGAQLLCGRNSICARVQYLSAGCAFSSGMIK